MAYPLPTAAISVSGEAVPTYLTGSLSGSYSTGQTFSLSSVTTWLEVGTNGQITANPLGTSGLFVIAVDFGLSTEEHILCSSLNTSTGVVTVWTDGTYNGRGWDGTTISAHSAGSSSNANCFPMLGGTYFAGLSSVISTLSTTYTKLPTYQVRTTSASVNAGEFTYTATPSLTFTLPVSPTVGTVNTFYGIYPFTILSPATGVNIVSPFSTATSYSTGTKEPISYFWDGTEWRMLSSNRASQLVGIGQYGIPYGNSQTALTFLSAVTATAANFLTSTGSGTGVATAPTWTGSTGTGNVVLANNPTITGTISLGTVATGVWNGTPITNTYIANPQVTVNGTTIALGASGTIATSQTATLRTGAATATAGEYSVLTGSSGFTLTLPTSPPNGTINTVANYATVNLTVSRGGTDTLTQEQGTANIVTGLTTTQIQGGVTTVFTYESGVWYFSASQVTGSGPIVYGNGPSFGGATPASFGSGLVTYNATNSPITIYDNSGNGYTASLTFSSGSNNQTFYLPSGTANSDTLVANTIPATLTNKTISGSNNTLSGIAPSSLTASAVTVGSTSIGLGATATTVAGLTLTSPTANNAIISTTSSGTIPMVVRGAVSQTADLEEWQNSASTVLAKIDAGGNLVAQSITPSGIGTATASTRYVGGTNNGYPTVGTFAVGDFIVDHSATIWVCSSSSVTYALTAAVSGSSTITYTTSATSVPKVGDYITVTGFSPTAFNVTGLAVISSNLGAKQFSVGASASGLTATGTGTGITNGYWSPTESQSVTTRSSGSATAQLGELTLFSPSATANLTLTMPANPVAGSQYTVINNNATYSVKLSGPLSLQGVTTTLYSVDPGEAYGFVYDGTNYWYNTWTTDITNLVGILPTTNGGTGLNGFTAANNALYSTSASALTAGTLPIVAGGTGATSASGVLTNIGASPATGSSSISTVGTITSGVWNGTAISNTYLANSSVTIGSTNVALGATATAITGLTLSGTANTFSGIPASALSASAVTIGTTTIGLGATATTVNGLTIGGASATNPAGGGFPGFITFSNGSTGYTQLVGNSATGMNFLTFPTISGSDTLVAVATTQTLTNKTLTSPTATNAIINTTASGTVPLTVNGAVSQTADLFDAKNSAGSVLFSISSAGLVSATNYIQGAQGITVNTSSTGSSSDAVTLTDRSSTATPKSVSLRAKSSTSGGGLEAINDAFSQSIMSLTNTGAFSTFGGTIFWSINSVTASAYTTVLSDGGALITLSAASATTVTIPPASSVAYPVGTQLNIVGTAASANTVTIQGGSGVTVQSTGATSSAPKLRTQYSSASVIQYATNTWLVVGDIA